MSLLLDKILSGIAWDCLEMFEFAVYLFVERFCSPFVSFQLLIGRIEFPLQSTGDTPFADGKTHLLQHQSLQFLSE